MTNETATVHDAAFNFDEPKLDLYLLRALLDTIKERREEIEWLLQKQGQLRTEFVTFYKKDRAEIKASLENQNMPEKEIFQILGTISEQFRSDIEKSFALINARYQKMVQEQVIRIAAEKIHDTNMKNIAGRVQLEKIEQGLEIIRKELASLDVKVVAQGSQKRMLKLLENLLSDTQKIK